MQERRGGYADSWGDLAETERRRRKGTEERRKAALEERVLPVASECKPWKSLGSLRRP